MDFRSARPVEIVNLRLRMVAAGEPYVPERRELVAGDGSAACYAEREMFFEADSGRRASIGAKSLCPAMRLQGRR